MDSRTIQTQIASLEQTLRQQLSLNSELLELLKRKRDVLRASDTQAVIGLCTLEHEKIQKIADLERQRLNQAADLTLLVDPQASEPMNLAELADHLGEPSRGRLLVMRHQLLDRMKAVHEETVIVRSATEALAKHMHGIVQTIGALSAGVSTYGNRGAFPQSNTAVSTFSATA
jgi:23S rRNA A2030 N6-methylase RlmJ